MWSEKLCIASFSLWDYSSSRKWLCNWNCSFTVRLYHSRPCARSLRAVCLSARTQPIFPSAPPNLLAFKSWLSPLREALSVSNTPLLASPRSTSLSHNFILVIRVLFGCRENLSVCCCEPVLTCNRQGSNYRPTRICWRKYFLHKYLFTSFRVKDSSLKWVELRIEFLYVGGWVAVRWSWWIRSWQLETGASGRSFERGSCWGHSYWHRVYLT